MESPTPPPDAGPQSEDRPAEIAFRCHGCGHVLGLTDGRSLRLGDYAHVRGRVVLTCPACGRARQWRRDPSLPS